MINYVQYLPSGQIVAYGVTQASAIEGQEGFMVCEPYVRNDTHYVADGQLVEMPQRPSKHHKFNYTTKEWEQDLEAAWNDVRIQRQRLLLESDWTALQGVPMSEELKQAWASYRQALRDVTQQPDPLHITWPTKPV